MPRGRKKTVTSADVAKLAGVSPASVTRVFNPDWEMNIRPEIRAKVMAAANELNYTPNAFARMLAGRKTDLVAIVLGPVTGPYYSRVLLSFISKLQMQGKQVLPFTMAGGMSYRELFERIKPFRVDAIILTSAASPAVYEPNETDIPVILFEQVINGLSIHSVCSDSFAGGRTVAEMLVENGHRRIAFISGNGICNQDFDREYGFASRMNEYGLKVWRTEVGKYAHYDSGWDAAVRLLTGSERPDAIFCADDVLAMGAMDAIRDRFGLSVPDDISVVGFHDIQQASLPPYSLTTMHSPIDVMVDAVVGIIDGLGEKSRENERELFTMKPVIRNSMRIENPRYEQLRRAQLETERPRRNTINSAQL